MTLNRSTPNRTIVSGDFHPFLENALLERLTDSIRDDAAAPRPVVVPTNLLRLRLSRLLTDRTGGHLNVRFLTILDFATWLAPMPLPGSESSLPQGADDVLMRGLLRDGAAEGGYFEAIASRPGLARALLAAIRDLKEASYDPDTFGEAARKAGMFGGGRRRKLPELTRLWAAYEQELEDGRWADDADLLRTAAVETGGARDPLPPLIVYGFYDLNPLQRRLLAAYAGRADTTVFYPYVPLDCFRYALPTLEWLRSIGFVDGETSVDGSEIPLPAGEIRIVSAPGDAREALEDVRLLVEIAEEDGIAYQDMAILLRTPESYAEPFSEELSRVSRNAYIEAPPPLSRIRTAKAALALAAAVESEFARADVIDFLSLADLDLGGGDGETPVTDWNKASILAGVVSGAASWIEKLGDLRGRLERAGPESGFAERHGHLVGTLEPLAGIIERAGEALGREPRRATVGAFLDWFIALFDELTRPSDERRRVTRELRALRALSEPAGPVDRSTFLDLLRARLADPGERGQRFGVGGPNVLSLMSARGLRFRAVVVPGLLEKRFPLARRQDPILLDYERERLNGTRDHDPLALLPIRGTGIEEEELLFRIALASAEDTLVLSFPRVEPATAQQRTPSYFLLSVLDELGGTRHDYEKLERSDRVTRVPLSRRFPADRSRSLTDSEFDGCSILKAIETGVPSEIAYLLSEDEPLAPRLAMEEARWENSFFTQYDGAVTSPEALAAVEALSGITRDGTVDGRTIGATALEEYADCPFRFFMHHVLRIEPLDETGAELALTPLERGSLYHAVLERFMKRMRRREMLPLNEHPDSAPELRRVADELIRSPDLSLAGLWGALDLALKDLALHLGLWLAGETLDTSGYVPSYFEARFGGDPRPGDDPELSLADGVAFEALGGVRVHFTGKIDRIDLSRDGSRARVIDYKTGNVKTKGTKKKPKLLDKGRQLQLPVYMLATERMLAARGQATTVDSAEYHYVTSGGGKTLAFTADALDGSREDLRKAVGYIIKGIADGLFPCIPSGSSSCRYCDYADACGPTALALALMKYGDPKAAPSVRGLAEIP